MRIVLLEPLGAADEIIVSLGKTIEEGGHEFIMYGDKPVNQSELARRAADADVVILSNLPFPDEVVEECKNLKLISVAFTGVDHIGMDACRKMGIQVRNAAGYSTSSVAELAFGLMIAVLRNIVKCHSAVREGKTKDGLIGHDLCGKTLGIIGTGAIGMKVAEIGRAFGCKLLAYSRTMKEEAENIGLEYVSLDELLTKSDIVTLHVPLNKHTESLINRERLSLMKEGSILINTARGPVVDSNALADALNEGRIAGAGIDVFETEPPISPDHPLLKAKNAVLTPHVAFATKEALERRAEIAFDNVVSWMEGIEKNLVL
ncbi:MAG TPA: hydroxyacid dehydrogenase [Clostridiales bacterium]|jgi:phosphoglycerate dehydrogenase-like enzyme|nr:hydroxyacid dehydrogenase [Clostridiales bacterium]